MSLATYINEGLIKLPAVATSEVKSFFLTTYLGALKAKLSASAFDKVEKRMGEAAIAQLCRRFDVEEPALQPKLLTVNVQQKVIDFQVPAAYASKITAKGLTAAVPVKFKTIIVLKGAHPKVNANESGVFYEDPPLMVLNVKGLQLDVGTVTDLIMGGGVREVEHTISNALTTIEHELTHGVQFLVLKLFHGKQADAEGAKGAKKGPGDFDDRYYTSQLEFDPLIKSAIKELQIKISSKKLEGEQRKELLHTYTWDDTPIAQLPDETVKGRSDFFKALKRTDYTRWKKAVKLVTIGVLK